MTAELMITAADLPAARLDACPGDRHPYHVYLASLSPGSRATVRRRLRRCVDVMAPGRFADPADFPWRTVTYAVIAAVRSRLAEEVASTTANATLSALKAVLRECWRLGEIDAEQYYRARDVAAVKGSRPIAGRYVDRGEVRKMERACERDRGPAGIRDAAMIAILFGAGVRRAELAALDLGDLDADESRLTVAGKGGKTRIAFLPPRAIEPIRRWLKIRGDAPGPLLGHTTQGREGTVTIAAMSTYAIYAALKRRARQAGIKTMSPHDCRRSHCSWLLEETGDLRHAQEQLGHASPMVTARYDRRPDEERKATIARISW